MEKIQETCSQSVMTKLTSKSSGSKYYRLSLAQKGDRFLARCTLKISDLGQNPRLEATVQNKDDAVFKLLTKIFDALKEAVINNTVNYEKLFKIFDGISVSITELNLNHSPITTYFYSIMGTCYLMVNSNETNTTNNEITILPTEVNTNSKGFTDVAREWFRYKYEFTKKSADNPNPLSRKTLDNYNTIMNLYLIPFFKDNQNIDSLTNENFKSLIDKTNGPRQKENVYIVLNMILNFAREKKYLSYLRTIKKPIKPQVKSILKIEGHDLNYIESDRQSIWIEYFQKENTDISLLFETMLLSGLRHSFATFLSEHGVQDIVLMKVMGHADFKTTQKYYIFVSNKRKQEQLLRAWASLGNILPPEPPENMQATEADLTAVQNIWNNEKSA